MSFKICLFPLIGLVKLCLKVVPLRQAFQQWPARWAGSHECELERTAERHGNSRTNTKPKRLNKPKVNQRLNQQKNPQRNPETNYINVRSAGKSKCGHHNEGSMGVYRLSTNFATPEQDESVHTGSKEQSEAEPRSCVKPRQHKHCPFINPTTLSNPWYNLSSL